MQLLLPIARGVLSKLLIPERCPRLWTIGQRTAPMAMPEAAMHKDYGAVPRQNEIRTARKLPKMKAKSESRTMQSPTNRNLGLRIRPADPRHQFASPLSRDHVRHLTLTLKAALLRPARKQAEN